MASGTLLTLPELSNRIGVSLDRLRKAVKADLAPNGFAVKVGSSWIVEAKDASTIADRLAPKN